MDQRSDGARELAGAAASGPLHAHAEGGEGESRRLRQPVKPVEADKGAIPEEDGDAVHQAADDGQHQRPLDEGGESQRGGGQPQPIAADLHRGRPRLLLEGESYLC
jgi:hypothetical protein